MNTYTEYLPFSVVSTFLKDILQMGGYIEDNIVSDTQIEINNVVYRIGIGKDGDCVTITIRRGPGIAINPDYKPNSFITTTNLIEVKEEDIKLRDSYSNEDANNLINLALQNGLLIFSSQTGMGKSTAMRNISSEILETIVNKEGLFYKIMEISDTIEYRNLNITQLKMNEYEANEFGEKIIKRANPNLIIYGEIRSPEFFKSVLNISNVLSVMTTMHSSDVLTAIKQLKT